MLSSDSFYYRKWPLVIMEERCYFCGKTKEECQSVIDDIIDNNIEALSKDERVQKILKGHKYSEKYTIDGKIKGDIFRQAVYETFHIDVEMKQVSFLISTPLKVPCCTICEGYINTLFEYHKV